MKHIVSLSLTPTSTENEKSCLVWSGSDWIIEPYSGDSIVYNGVKHHFYSAKFVAPVLKNFNFYIKDGANDVAVSQKYFEDNL